MPKVGNDSSAGTGNTNASPGDHDPPPPPPASGRMSNLKSPHGKTPRAPPATRKDGVDRASDGMFELAYGIAHDGGALMKCKWAPEGGRDGRMGRGTREGGGVLGMLGAVFEDGSLR